MTPTPSAPPIPRTATAADHAPILALHGAAFGDEGADIVELLDRLLIDPTATPMLSLLVDDGPEPVGHVLFTTVHLDPPTAIAAAILAPLAVAATHRKRGIGGLLIRDGLARLAEADVGLVFVLGDPGYYGRFGFRPAGALGLNAPHPIPAEYRDAWMVLALRDGVLGEVRGTVRCADSLSDRRYWID